MDRSATDPTVPAILLDSMPLRAMRAAMPRSRTQPRTPGPQLTARDPVSATTPLVHATRHERSPSVAAAPTQSDTEGFELRRSELTLSTTKIISSQLMIRPSAETSRSPPTSIFVGRLGLEPRTYGLKVRSSAVSVSVAQCRLIPIAQVETRDVHFRVPLRAAQCRAMFR